MTSISGIEDAIKKEIEFTTILANSIVARNALCEHECAYDGCPHDIGCGLARRLIKIDEKAYQLAIFAIEERFDIVQARDILING